MRLLTLRLDEGTRAGRIDGDLVTELPFSDVGSLLAHPEWRQLAGGRGTRARRLEEVDLAPLVPHPSKIFCVGHNYTSHILEMGHELPSHPTLFAKFARTLTGPADPIVLPAASERVDWEAELALVIGRRVRHASLETALAAIAGYTVVNDISARDYQWRTPQWLQGKCFEQTTPLGPALVTPDEVDHARDLEIRCEVDGVTMQRARTSDMLFRPEAIVAYVSQIITLDPGDVVATGTPAGVGDSRRPSVYLHEGQVVRTSIEGVGTLINRCVRETS